MAVRTGLGCLVLAGLLLAGLQTEAGLNAAAGLVARLVSAATGQTVRLEAVSGTFPLSLTLGRLAVADKKGVWLVIKDLHAAWSPAALLRGRVHVDDLSADIVRVRRQPELPPLPNQPPQIEWPPRFPSLPPMLFDRLAVNRLILDKELVGQDAELGLTGRLAESGRGAVALSLDGQRHGGPPLTLTVAGSLNYAAWRLALRAKLADAPGGLLAAALAGPEAGPVDVRLTGDGPLDAWQGDLTASLAGARLVAAKLGLAVPLTAKAVAAWTLDAVLTPPPAPVAPWAADLTRIVGDRLTLTAAGRLGIISGAFFLDRSNVRAGCGDLAATASLDPDTDAVAATVTAHLPEVGRLVADLAGSATATLTASGRLARPELAVKLTAQGLAAGAVRLATADLDAHATLAGDLDGPFPGAAVTATGRLGGLTGPEGTALLGRDLSLALTAALDPSGAIAAQNVSLTGPDGVLRLTGRLDSQGALAGTLRLTAANVAGAASLGGLSLTGRAEATAEIARDAAGAGQAGLRVTLADVTAGRPDLSASLAELLGKSPSLTAQLALTGQNVRLTSLTLDGRLLRLDGSADLQTATGTLTAAKVTADLADLSPLTAALGQPMAGKAHVDVTADGTGAKLAVTAKGQVTGLRAGETRLDDLALEAAATDLAQAPSGRLRLRAQRQGETASLETTFALRGRTLALPDLRLAAPDTTLSAKASLDLAGGTATGDLSAASTDLAGLGRFVGLPLAGSLKLTAKAASGRFGQGLAAQLTATGLTAAGLTLRDLSLSADLDDVTRRPRGQAALAATGLASGGWKLANLKLAANGNERGLDLHLNTQGTLPGGQRLQLATAARLAEQGGRREIRLASLAGQLDKHAFALVRPATVSFAPGSLAVDDLALTLEGAVLTAAGTLRPAAVAGKVELAKLPLALLGTFGVTGLTGTAKAHLDVSGSPARPHLTAQARVDDFKPVSNQSRSLPAMTVNASLTLDGRTLAATAALAQSGKKDMLTATVGLPARFALSPVVLELPPDGALTGKFTANGDLTDLGALLAQANMRVVGHLGADLTLAGTRAAPALTGSLTLAASRLENADIGLVLRDIAIRLDAANGVLTVTKATGRDLHNGSFSLAGFAGPWAAGDAPVSLATRLDHLKVAGLDMVSATADGAIELSGTVSRLTARGKLTIGPAEINLPTSLPPSVVVIPVTDVNDAKAPPAAKKHAPPALARQLALDITAVLGRSVYVRGLGVESRWGGSVAITGTADDPRGRGRLTVEQGTVDLFGGNLAITKGEVNFDGQSLLSPQLHVVATNTIDDVTAGISLTGDAGNPTIALISQPPLPDNEILSRILFGQSASSLSPLQAAQLAQATASLYSGGGPTTILARTRRILGLDRLAIVPGRQNLQATVLKAGKEIAKGVTVGVEQGMGAQSGAVTVEVKITPNITVDSRVGADNKQGVGVNWKWDY